MALGTLLVDARAGLLLLTPVASETRADVSYGSVAADKSKLERLLLANDCGGYAAYATAA